MTLSFEYGPEEADLISYEDIMLYWQSMTMKTMEEMQALEEVD